MSVCHEIGQAQTQDTHLDPVYYTPMKNPVVVCAAPVAHIFDRSTHQQLVDRREPCPICRGVLYPVPQEAPWRKRIAYRVAYTLTSYKEIIFLSGKIIGSCSAIVFITVPSVKRIVQDAWEPGYILSFIFSPRPEISYYDRADKVDAIYRTVILAAICCATLGTIARIAWNWRRG